MRKTILIVLLFILGFVIFIPVNFYIGNLVVYNILFESMNSRIYIYTEENDKTFFNKYELSNKELAVASKYTFVDLDSDMTKELVILTKSDSETYIVLRCDKKKNKVYSYEVNDLEKSKNIDMSNFIKCSSKNECRWYTYGIN